MEFFSTLDPLLRTFWYIAMPVSVIFLVQSVMTFMGSDASDGVQADFDSNLEGADTPFQLFSFRNLINFLLGFSWSGISFYATISNSVLLISLSALIGVLFVVLFFLIITQLQSLAEDNTFKITETLNKQAEVYLPIPAAGKGKGKVLISVRGSVHELDAVTQGEKIETGTLVRVTDTDGKSILIVKSL